MPGKFEAPKRGRQPRRRRSPIIPILLILIALLTAGLVYTAVKILPNLNKPAPVVTEAPTTEAPTTEPTTEATEPPTEETVPETTLPEPETVVATATVSAMGDLLMHTPLFQQQYQSAAYLGDGNYDFDHIFRYLTPYTTAADYAVANLETTLAGTAKPYSGYPYFNCPDQIAADAKKAGFDMLLTANNHCFDTGIDGYKRTLEVCREAGLETLGTMASDDEPKYVIQDVNGIKIGMICYTYETTNGTGSIPSLNGNPMNGGSYGMINCFSPTNLQPFYDQIEGYIAEMKEAGAEATMLFIHWGVEYLTYANDNQKAMAQKLCDLGIDVIVGGHPHVVEPVALLESSVDPDHKTVCVYSLGNAVSNQRLGNISYVSTAHTEDGLLFSVTFEKYSDGRVYLQGTDLIPTWVNRHQNENHKTEYNILPLDEGRREEWKELYALNDSTLTALGKSYDRTMAIVSEGLETCQTWLDQAKADREQYYYDLAFFPERFETEPTEEAVEIADVTIAETEAEMAA